MRFLTLLLFAFAALAAPSAHAANFDVHPIIVELSAKTGSGTIAITNRSDEALRLHVTAFSWAQSEDGEMILKPSKDIVFFPAMLSMKPKESRQIRIGSRLKPGAVERSYRLFVQELPPPQRNLQDGDNAVAVLTKMGLPVFLAALKPAVAPRLTPLSVKGKKLTFSLQNVGNTHMRVQKVTLTAKGAKGKVHEESLRAWYVLAGGKHTYQVDLPDEVCKEATSLSVKVESVDGSTSGKLDRFSCQ